MSLPESIIQAFLKAHSSTPDNKITVWDKEAVVMFEGPIRTVTGHIHKHRADGKCQYCEIEKHEQKRLGTEFSDTYHPPIRSHADYGGKKS
jgi:hypothetical protein